MTSYLDELLPCLSLAVRMLGITSKNLQMHDYNKLWFWLALLTVRGIIVRQWKSVTPSSFAHSIVGLWTSHIKNDQKAWGQFHKDIID